MIQVKRQNIMQWEVRRGHDQKACRWLLPCSQYTALFGLENYLCLWTDHFRGLKAIQIAVLLREY
jgi:hypothetical protein